MALTTLGTPDLHNKKDSERKQQRGLHVLVCSGVPRYGNGGKHSQEAVAELPDGYRPCVRIKPEVQDDLWHDGIHRAIEDPALDSKGKRGECEVRVPAEENVGDETICPPLPFWF